MPTIDLTAERPDPNEWFGRLHTLIVHGLGEPGGFDGLRPIRDYEIIHSLTCPAENRVWHSGMEPEAVFCCDVAFQEQDGDLAFTLKYSGTEVTEPGTYLIQGWGRKYCSGPDFLTEYDGGIAVVEGAT